jgi:hypothetical protein
MEKALHQPSLVSFRPWRQHCSWPLDVGANSEHTSPRHSHRPTTVVDRGLWGDTGTFRHLRARWGFSRNLFQQGCAHDFWGPQTPLQASRSARMFSPASRKARCLHHSLPNSHVSEPTRSEAHRVHQLTRRPCLPDPRLATFQRTPCAPRGYNGQ